MNNPQQREMAHRTLLHRSPRNGDYCVLVPGGPCDEHAQAGMKNEIAAMMLRSMELMDPKAARIH